MSLILRFIYNNSDSASVKVYVFLDIVKAFDVVDHGISLTKLSRYEIRGTASFWFRFHLSDMNQFNSFDGHNS